MRCGQDDLCAARTPCISQSRNGHQLIHGPDSREDYMKRSVSALALGGAIAGLIIPTPAYTQTPAAVFVAPPRTIADITAILDQEKPDTKAVSSMRAAADATPPPGAGRADLARFYYSRCQAHGNLGQT